MWTTLPGFLGICGTTLVVLAILVPALLYRGRAGERFSIFNHFISELGEEGISRGARAFNLGLILGGLCLLPVVVQVGTLFQSIPGWLGMAAGCVASLGVSAVGIFPMNNLKPHGRAAMTFFRGGLVMLLLFGLALLLQPKGGEVLPKTLGLLNLAGILAYSAFLVIMTLKSREPKEEDGLDPLAAPERPRFWLLPTLEWAVFFTTVLWLLPVSILLISR